MVKAAAPPTQVAKVVVVAGVAAVADPGLADMATGLAVVSTAVPVVAEMGKARTHEAVRLTCPSRTGIDSCSSTGCH